MPGVLCHGQSTPSRERAPRTKVPAQGTFGRAARAVRPDCGGPDSLAGRWRAGRLLAAKSGTGSARPQRRAARAARQHRPAARPAAGDLRTQPRSPRPMTTSRPVTPHRLESAANSTPTDGITLNDDEGEGENARRAVRYTCGNLGVRQLGCTEPSAKRGWLAALPAGARIWLSCATGASYQDTRRGDPGAAWPSSTAPRWSRASWNCRLPGHPALVPGAGRVPDLAKAAAPCRQRSGMSCLCRVPPAR